jgi:hypothetical protein
MGRGHIIAGFDAHFFEGSDMASCDISHIEAVS